MSRRPLILLTNDDGHHARGVHALRDAMRRSAEVVIVAPESEQSATSHSLSLHRPLRLRSVEQGIFAVDGTPADCVYVALHALGRALERLPDLVVSGLNHGVNLGSDVFYSGTVGGAREGALRGIPSLAASADTEADWAAAATRTAEVTLAFLSHLEQQPAAPGAFQAPLLNLNIPAGKGPWPVRATTLGLRLYEEEVVFFNDPRGREYLWIGGRNVSHGPGPGTDTEAHDAGIASLTPLVLNLTHKGYAEFANTVVQSLGEGSDGSS